jgi:hypothetical protein
MEWLVYRNRRHAGSCGFRRFFMLANHPAEYFFNNRRPQD